MITAMLSHFCLSISGPLHAAETPQESSLKSTWPSWFSSNAEKNESTREAGSGGDTRGATTSL